MQDNREYVGVKIELDPRAGTPKYATLESAGCDLCSLDEYELYQNQPRLIHTGIKIALPVGYEAQIRSRSGLALKHGVVVLNSPGTIDSDYRGEIGVILIKLTEGTHKILPGDRIAQMIVSQVPRISFIKVDKLDNTVRGEGGFGSTGNK